MKRQEISPWGRSLRIGFVVAVSAFFHPMAAAPQVRFETLRVLEVQALAVAPPHNTALKQIEFEVPEGRTGQARVRLAWPHRPAKTLNVELRALEVPDPSPREGRDPETFTLLLETTTKPAGGDPVRVSRRLRLGSTGPALVEVYRDEDGALVLAVAARTERRPVVLTAAPSPTRPVRILAEVLRAMDGEAVLLESNQLNTFLGQPVGYSFRRATELGEEALRLTVRPLRVQGEILELEVRVDGEIPGPEGPLLISRRERLVTTRATASTFEFRPEGAAGYQFRLTPAF